MISYKKKLILIRFIIILLIKIIIQTENAENIKNIKINHLFRIVMK